MFICEGEVHLLYIETGNFLVDDYFFFRFRKVIIFNCATEKQTNYFVPNQTSGLRAMKISIKKYKYTDSKKKNCGEILESNNITTQKKRKK